MLNAPTLARWIAGQPGLVIGSGHAVAVEQRRAALDVMHLAGLVQQQLARVGSLAHLFLCSRCFSLFPLCCTGPSGSHSACRSLAQMALRASTDKSAD